MIRLLMFLATILPAIIWVIPIAKGAKEQQRSEEYEAISDDLDVELDQRNRFVRHALNSRKKSEKYLLWGGCLLFLHYFVFTLVIVNH